MNSKSIGRLCRCSSGYYSAFANLGCLGRDCYPESLPDKGPANHRLKADRAFRPEGTKASSQPSFGGTVESCLPQAPQLGRSVGRPNHAVSRNGGPGIRQTVRLLEEGPPVRTQSERGVGRTGIAATEPA